MRVKSEKRVKGKQYVESNERNCQEKVPGKIL